MCPPPRARAPRVNRCGVTIELEWPGWWLEPDGDMALVRRVDAVVDDLVDIEDQLQHIRWCVELAVRFLLNAAGLLADSTDAAEDLFHGAVAVVAPDSPLLQASANAAARLAAGVFAGPLAAAVEGAEAQVNHLCATGGLLQVPMRDVGILDSAHTNAALRFGGCAPHIRVEPGDELWWRWRRQRVEATIAAKEAYLRLGHAAGLAGEALDVLRSPSRGPQVEEAEEVLREAIDHVEMAREALDVMDTAVVLERLAILEIMDTHA
ncbi:hypothetical protein E2562_036577 [Oryza meyeriana var. granulata]|uniref:Uncharacterized protein n=1 Tax=Oryza meyeriana var. granulata TaxID=110450 RepID=A0A6G1ECQ8_9ORYZ|nr:hypothetical protein E2562_036577 [Oryza meyeriana var. granulata]